MERARGHGEADGQREAPVAARAQAATTPAAHLLALQAAAGNAAVARMLRPGRVLARNYTDVDGKPVTPARPGPAPPVTLADAGAAVGHGALAAGLKGSTAKWAGKALSLDEGYRNERESSSKDVKAAIASAEADVGKGKGDFRTIFKTAFGWDDANIDKYIKDVEGRHELAEETRVEQLEEARRAELEVDGATLAFGKRPSRPVLDTADMFSKRGGRGTAIYVLLADGRLLVGDHKIGLFHHSSLAGGDTVVGAGDITVARGEVKALSNHSGHFKPETDHMVNVLKALRERGVRLPDDLPLTIALPDGTASVLPLRDFARIAKEALGEPAPSGQGPDPAPASSPPPDKGHTLT